jgi:4-hydroxybenzoate polyprenyltransferase
MATEVRPDEDGGGWRAWAELVRLPNAFSAVADVAAGYLLRHPSLEQWWELAILAGASIQLYWAGMILNDVFDVDVDQEKRPRRPLPSGRIKVETARRAGFVLLGGGIVTGWVAAGVCGEWFPGAVAMLIAAAVVAYDRFLKATVLGPLCMGACRFFNLLLGMSAAGIPTDRAHWIAAGGLGVYVAGITIYARREAETSSRILLLAGAAVLLCGMGVLATFPEWTSDTVLRSPSQKRLWFALWGLLGANVGWRLLRGLLDPAPSRVQGAVMHALYSLVVLDAALAFAARGPLLGMAVVVLIVPVVVLGRWVYGT